jgi:hypothetical protein
MLERFKATQAKLCFLAGLIEPGRQIWVELPRVNPCAWRASQRHSATALFEPGS